MWPWEKAHSRLKFDISETEIINHLTDGILVLDKNGKILLANNAAEKILTIEKERVIGRTIFWLDRFIILSPHIPLFSKKKEEKEAQIRENLILKITTVPTFSENNKVGVLVILHDITKEKIIEKAKSDFLTLATHQLWTPTSAIKWSLRMLLDGEFGKLTKKQEEIVKKIYETNNREIKLVGDLLQVAKIEEGKYLSNLKLLNINELIAAVINNYQKIIKKQRLTLKFNKEAVVPNIMADEIKMRIAIENILNNSIKYTPPRGKISISVSKIDQDEVKIKISDTGIGIPKNQQNRVFTKFFRASNVIQRDTEGTGLGLYMAKNIIEAHGGEIWFESEEGKGTTFYITLPIKKRFGEFITSKFY
ncbi:MAG TPA: PAS domain-containing protein [Candidatus Parcubacteria bacterium]|nr:PAS domain-containing protein [Candidatus Parcubacteria bacterium]